MTGKSDRLKGNDMRGLRPRAPAKGRRPLDPVHRPGHSGKAVETSIFERLQGCGAVGPAGVQGRRPRALSSLYIITCIIFLYGIISPSPASADDRFARAETLRESSYYERAQAEYEALVPDRFHAKRREILLGLGECLLMRDRLDDLKTLCERAAEEFPDSALAHAGLALAHAARAKRSTKFYYAIRQAGEAQSHVGKALRLDRDCALAWFVRGLLHYHMPKWQGNLPEAANDFQRALATFDPFLPRIRKAAYLHLALARRRLRQNREAVLVLERAVLHHPDDPRFRALLERARADSERGK